MEKLNSRFHTILFVIGSTLLAYLVLYVPINNQLTEALIDKWRLSAQANVFSLNLALQQSIEGGQSMSSRSAIRDKIVQYQQGAVSWQELQDFTNPKYSDGAAVLENLVFAYRMVDDQLLVVYTVPGTKLTLDDFNLPGETLLSNRILQKDGMTYFLTRSEVRSGDLLLGFDVVCYDLTNIVNELKSHVDAFEILSSAEVSPDSLAQYSENGISLGKNEIGYMEKLSAVEAVVIIRSSRSRVLGDTHQDADSYLLLYIFLIILLYLLCSQVFVRKTREVIQKIEGSKQNYMKLAYWDALTGAHSRQFLNYWVQQHADGVDPAKNRFVLVLMDVDHLKQINDQYGHDAGDDVLMALVETTQKFLRKEDLMVRIGGDEFLLILEGVDEQTVGVILKRIELELGKTNIESIRLSVSYGIASIDRADYLQDGIKQADIKMYASKRNKNTP